MANLKVSEMTEATTFDDDDYTMIVQSNQSKKISKENMLGGIETDISDLETGVGNLTNLETIDKTSVVDSINSIVNANNYSTNETDTGKTWIDSKKIYRKVIDLGTIANQTSIALGNGYDTIISFSGYMYKDDGSKSSIIEYDDSQMWKVFSFTVSSGGVGTVLSNRATLGQWSDWKLKVIVEYTKLTT